jgi:PiT family inorganic phosphate transporter
MHSELLLVIVVVVALGFDITNGFHDTANVIAPAVSTRAMSPRGAVALAAVLNFVGALLSLKVASTIGTGIIVAGRVTELIVFAGLAGAIAWNLLTWMYGLPSSSSHALIGGLIGSLLASVGSGGVRWHGLLTKVVVPGLLSPVVAFLVAGAGIVAIYRVLGRRNPGRVTRGFRGGQILTSAALSLAHGTNDAQKTMGVIAVALFAHGSLGHHFHVPLWVVLSAASAMALGTYVGGWRIIRTVGMRIIKMDSAQGATAQTAGAAVILLSSHLGYPLSSTQVISGSVMGAGAGKRLSAVRWGVAGNIVVGWVLTLPLSGLLGALAYELARLFGRGALGPALIVLITAGALTYALRARRLVAAPAR